MRLLCFRLGVLRWGSCFGGLVVCVVASVRFWVAGQCGSWVWWFGYSLVSWVCDLV